MKKRHGFVSNSSSSSFLVIDKSGAMDDSLEGIVGEYSFGDKGVTEFGWGPETLTDIFSRINFAYLQATYFDESNAEKFILDKNSMLLMLEEVIMSNSKITDINWLLSSDYDVGKSEGKVWGYIDHQSSACDGANMEIFDNEKILKDFIFGKNYIIEVQNDNS